MTLIVVAWTRKNYRKFALLAMEPWGNRAPSLELFAMKVVYIYIGYSITYIRFRVKDGDKFKALAKKLKVRLKQHLRSYISRSKRIYRFFSRVCAQMECRLIPLELIIK